MQKDFQRDHSDLVRRTVEKFAFEYDVPAKPIPDVLSTLVLYSITSLVIFLIFSIVGGEYPNKMGSFIWLILSYLIYISISLRSHLDIIFSGKSYIERKLILILKNKFGNFITTYYFGNVLYEAVIALITISTIALVTLTIDGGSRALSAVLGFICFGIVADVVLTAVRILHGEFGTQAREAELLIKFIIRRVNESNLPPTDGTLARDPQIKSGLSEIKTSFGVAGHGSFEKSFVSSALEID